MTADRSTPRTSRGRGDRIATGLGIAGLLGLAGLLGSVGAACSVAEPTPSCASAAATPATSTPAAGAAGAAGAARASRATLGLEAELSARDVAMLEEAFHLQAELGAEVFPGWTPRRVPVLYLAGAHAFLIDHPAPPDGFEAVESAALGRTVHLRARRDDEGALQACFPIAGHSTVVIAAPAADDDPCRWALVCAHEMFHCFQGHGQRHLDPFTGEYAGLHELSYPFPYDDAAVKAAFRLEAEFVHRLATGKDAVESETGPSQAERTALKLLGTCETVQRAVLVDARHLLFKQWEEWNEGVAKYAERELSRAAATPGRYAPTEAFAALAPADGYASVWAGHYDGQLNPVRFVGAGVDGRVMFYYLGLGKAVALDRLFPAWKERYRGNSLDGLLGEVAGG